MPFSNPSLIKAINACNFTAIEKSILNDYANGETYKGIADKHHISALEAYRCVNRIIALLRKHMVLA